MSAQHTPELLERLTMAEAILTRLENQPQNAKSLTSTREHADEMKRIRAAIGQGRRERKVSGRALKVESSHREGKRIRKTVPKIRLEGAWLQRAGFEPESRVHVEVNEGTLVIRVEGSAK